MTNPIRKATRTRPEIIGSFRLMDGADYIRQYLESVRSTDDLAIWFRNRVPAIRHSIRGVPRSKITIAIEEPSNEPYCVWVVRIAIIKGRYDGSSRQEWCIRQMPLVECREWEEGLVRIVLTDDQAAIRVTSDPDIDVIARAKTDIFYAGSFDRLKSDLSGYDLPSILLWQWTRYYQMIPREDAEQLAAVFTNGIKPTDTLAEANQTASRMLYNLARDLGWRKLARHEQERYGVQGQWHKAESLIKDGTKQGVGQHTLDAASGKIPIYGPEAEVQMIVKWAVNKGGFPKETIPFIPPSVLANWLAERGKAEWAEKIAAAKSL